MIRKMYANERGSIEVIELLFVKEEDVIYSQLYSFVPVGIAMMSVRIVKYRFVSDSKLTVNM